LVGPGGKYEAYKPVFQGDNAGPHIDATYLAGIKGHCETKEEIISNFPKMVLNERISAPNN
jgi:hypothetical protein